MSSLWNLSDKIWLDPPTLTAVSAVNHVNTLRPRQIGRHFANDNFKCIFLNEDARKALEISLKFVPKVPINNIPALVQIMAWRRPGDKPLSEPMMVSLLTHICVTRPQWVNVITWAHFLHYWPFWWEKPLVPGRWGTCSSLLVQTFGTQIKLHDGDLTLMWHCNFNCFVSLDYISGTHKIAMDQSCAGVI